MAGGYLFNGLKLFRLIYQTAEPNDPSTEPQGSVDHHLGIAALSIFTTAIV